MTKEELIARRRATLSARHAEELKESERSVHEQWNSLFQRIETLRVAEDVAIAAIKHSFAEQRATLEAEFDRDDLTIPSEPLNVEVDVSSINRLDRA